MTRATYAAVLCVGAFFVLTSWAMVAGAGGADAAVTVGADSGNFAYALTDEVVGSAWTDVLQVLIVTSAFAGVLAFHNAASRTSSPWLAGASCPGCSRVPSRGSDRRVPRAW